MYIVHMMITIAELEEFRTQAKKLLTQEELENLIVSLAMNPLQGDVMPKTGGFRKMRLARKGKGKSGGYRVIYYFYNENKPLLLTTIYAKKDKDNLTESQKNQLSELAAIIIKSLASSKAWVSDIISLACSRYNFDCSISCS